MGGRPRFEAQARLIAGPPDCRAATSTICGDLVHHLRHDGVRDRGMERLLARVEALEKKTAA